MCALITPPLLLRVAQNGSNVLAAAPVAVATTPAATGDGVANEAGCMMLVLHGDIDCEEPARNRQRIEPPQHRSTAVHRRTQRRRDPAAAASAAAVPTTGVQPFSSCQPVPNESAAVSAVTTPDQLCVACKAIMQTETQAHVAPTRGGALEQCTISDTSTNSCATAEVQSRKRSASLAFAAPGRKNAPVEGVSRLGRRGHAVGLSS